MRYKIFARSVDKYILKHIGKPLLTISNLERADKVLSHSKLPNVFHVIRNTMSEEINFSKIQNKQINLNNATETDLKSIPGVGPSKAREIINYREQNGGFKNIEDLKKN